MRDSAAKKQTRACHAAARGTCAIDRARLARSAGIPGIGIGGEIIDRVGAFLACLMPCIASCGEMFLGEESIFRLEGGCERRHCTQINTISSLRVATSASGAFGLKMVEITDLSGPDDDLGMATA